MTDAGKVFVSRLKVSFLQWFKEHLHLPFSKISMHLKKVVIHDMETKFGTGWSVKKIKNKCLKTARDFGATKQIR